jgi:TonB family protein
LNIPKVSSFAICIGVHALLVAWMLASPTHARNERRAASSAPLLQVSLLPAMPDSADSRNEPAIRQMPAKKEESSAPASVPMPAPKSDDSNDADNSSKSGSPIPEISHAPSYYPASELSRMPEAVSNFNPHLPAMEDNGIGGQMSMRLWINESGGIDRIKLLASEVPETFANAALAAFGEMRFSPGEIEGMAVKVWVDVVIEYAELRRQAEQQAMDTTGH